tara:strand:+ start:797 stop:1600 length:804 start_codon:yes stop_codon:yes gene_type:complete
MNEFTPNTEGTWLGLAESVYRSAPGVNISALKNAITPAHYRAVRDAEQPAAPSPAQVFGTACHAAALEGRTSFVTRPDGMVFTTKEGKAWRDAQTLPILTADEAKAIEGVRASLMAHAVAGVILGGAGQTEVSAFKLHASGLLLKGRADFVTQDSAGMTTIVDLKTTGFGDGAESAFAREVAKWKYHQQAAFYLDLFGASFFVFIVAEKEPPFAVNVFYLDAESIAQGRAENERSLALIASAEQSGDWPAYGGIMHTLTLPKWAKSI